MGNIVTCYNEINYDTDDEKEMTEHPFNVPNKTIKNRKKQKLTFV